MSRCPTLTVGLVVLTLVGCASRRAPSPTVTNDRPLWADTLRAEVRGGSDRDAWNRKTTAWRDHLRWDVPWPRPGNRR